MSGASLRIVMDVCVGNLQMIEMNGRCEMESRSLWLGSTGNRRELTSFTRFYIHVMHGSESGRDWAQANDAE